MDTTMITGALAITGTGLSLYDKENKSINKNNANSILTTTIATGATAAVGASMNAYTMHEIHEKYSSAYVESMSDEELEQALVKMDLLEAEQTIETDVKSL